MCISTEEALVNRGGCGASMYYSGTVPVTPVPSHDTEAALLAWLSKDSQLPSLYWAFGVVVARKASPSLENA